MSETQETLFSACRDTFVAAGWRVNYGYSADCFLTKNGFGLKLAVVKSGLVLAELTRWNEKREKYSAVSKVELPSGLPEQTLGAWLLQWVAFVTY